MRYSFAMAAWPGVRILLEGGEMAATRRGWGAVGLAAVAPVMALAALLAAGCGGSGAGGDALSLAPPDAFGVIHIELKPLVNSVLAELEKQKADLSDVPVDQIRRTAEKAAVMDVFLVPGSGMMPLGAVAIVRSPVSPADFGELMKAGGQKAPELKKLGNGRYGADDGDEQILIYGAEASDVPDGVLLLGDRALLTEEYLKKLGTGKNEKLRAMLGDVRSAAPLWLAASLEALPLPIPIKLTSMSGWFDPSGGGDGRVTVTFGDETSAKLAYTQAAGGLDEAAKEYVAIEQKGNVITVTPKGGDLLARTVSAFVSSRQEALRVRNMAQLRQVGLCIQMYGNDNEDAAPPDLAALAKYADGKLRDDLASNKTGYVYRKPAGALGTLAGETVLVHEALDGAAEEVAVLFADGSVKVMSVAKLRELLK